MIITKILIISYIFLTIGAHRPEDYLNFYCLGNRESEDGSEAKSNECDDPNRPKQRLLLNSRRFMIYVHSKMMIVDDEYIIFGNIHLSLFTSLPFSTSSEFSIIITTIIILLLL